MSVRKTAITAAAAMSLAVLPVAALAHESGKSEEHKQQGQLVEFHQDKGQSAQHFRGSRDDNEDINEDVNAKENEAENEAAEQEAEGSNRHIVFPQPASIDQSFNSNVNTPSENNVNTARPAAVKANVKGTDSGGNKFHFSFKGTLDQFGQFLSSIANFFGFTAK